ncbi:MAG TPA: hypothetical protein VKU02_16825 [Gemmataceae bacterium]|nr:hypothetical protein [Gemmataceae bacterium]
MIGLLLTATLALLADAGDVSSHFEFHDSATHDGHSILHYRSLEFANAPVRPTEVAVPPSSRARYSLLPVGTSPDAALTVIWDPQAPGGPQLWVDADGDGKLALAERHFFAKKELEVSVRIAVRSGAGGERLPRTIVFRRPAVGGGLSYAVRGYVAGTLKLGSEAFAALITDGNADGCFDTAGSDRIWIDLNRDGRFDGLTEQFLLGSPISVHGRIYIIRVNATASEVCVQPRSTARGKVCLTLMDKACPLVHDLAVQLVSNLGELVMLRDLSQPATLPVARYRVDSVLFRLTDAAGGMWAYRFAGGQQYTITIEDGKESTVAMLRGLTLEMSVAPPGPTVQPGQRLQVTLHLRTPSGLYLADCHRSTKESFQPIACMADIQLSASGGAPVDRASSGFA